MKGLEDSRLSEMLALSQTPLCADPDCASYPSYGPVPHICYYKIPEAKLGQSKVLPKESWPDNVVEDENCPGLSTTYCPSCKRGKPCPK